MNKIILLLAIGGFLLLFSFSSKFYKDPEGIDSPQDLLNAVKSVSEEMYLETGILPSVALGMVRLEVINKHNKISSFVRGKYGNRNIGNIKCTVHSRRNAPSIHSKCNKKKCKAQTNGCCNNIKDDHRCDRYIMMGTYKNGIKEFYRFLADNNNYNKAQEIIPNRLRSNMPLNKLQWSYYQQVKAIHAGGYATDKKWADKIINIIRRNKWYIIDKKILAKAHYKSKSKRKRNTSKKVWPEIVAIEEQLEKLKKRSLK